MDLGASQAGNAFIRRAEPADGTGVQLAEMRPDCVTIVSEQVTDTMGRVFKRPVGYEEDLKPSGITDREPAVLQRGRGGALRAGAGMPRGVQGHLVADAGAAGRGGRPGAHPVQDRAYQPGRAARPGDQVLPAAVPAGGGPAEEPVRGDVRGAGERGPDADPRRGRRCRRRGQHDGAAAVRGGAEGRGAAGLRGGRAGDARSILGFEQGDYQTAIRKLADLWARPAWRMACASLEHLLPARAVGGAPVVRRQRYRGAA